MDTKIEREFPTAVALAAASGCGIAGMTFHDVHDCLTHVLGWDVFTHELAEPGVWRNAHYRIIAVLPTIENAAYEVKRAAESIDRNDPATVASFGKVAAAALAKMPPTVWLPKGDGRRTESPLDSAARIAPNTPVITVTVPGPARN